MSQIATTIEQSNRLLEAGVLKDSADMSYRASAYQRDESGKWVPQKEGSIVYIIPQKAIGELDVPAWSLSALWQMVHELDKTYEFPTRLSADELIETLVTTIIYRRNHQ